MRDAADGSEARRFADRLEWLNASKGAGRKFPLYLYMALWKRSNQGPSERSCVRLDGPQRDATRTVSRRPTAEQPRADGIAIGGRAGQLTADIISRPTVRAVRSEERR